MVEATVTNGEWIRSPSKAAQLSFGLRLHLFGSVDASTAHLELSPALQDVYLVQLTEKYESGNLISMDSGINIFPFAMRGTEKTSPNRRNSALKIDQPGQHTDLVDYRYNK